MLLSFFTMQQNTHNHIDTEIDDRKYRRTRKADHEQAHSFFVDKDLSISLAHHDNIIKCKDVEK